MMRRFPTKGLQLTSGAKPPESSRREIFHRLRNIAKAALGHYDHLDTAGKTPRTSSKPVQEPLKATVAPRVSADPYTPPWLPPRVDQAPRQETAAKPAEEPLTPSVSPPQRQTLPKEETPSENSIPNEPCRPTAPPTAPAPKMQVNDPSTAVLRCPKPRPEPATPPINEGVEEINDALAEAERAELESLQREYSAAFAASEKLTPKRPQAPESPNPIEVEKKPLKVESVNPIECPPSVQAVQQGPLVAKEAPEKGAPIPSPPAPTLPQPQPVQVEAQSQPTSAPVESIMPDVQELLALQEEFLRSQEPGPDPQEPVSQPSQAAVSPVVLQPQSLPNPVEPKISAPTTTSAPVQPKPPTGTTKTSPPAANSVQSQSAHWKQGPKAAKGSNPRPNHYGEPKAMLRVRKGPHPFVYPTGLGIAEARQWHSQYTAVLPQVKEPNPLKTDADQNIHLVSTIDEAESAAQIIDSYCKHSCYLGMDVEWAVGKQASLLQVATGTDVFLFRLRQLDPESPDVLEMPLPDRLQDVLADPRIFKCTVSIDEDRKRLKAQTGVDLQGGIDLYHLFLHIGYPLGLQTGLKALTAHVCDVALDKDRRVRCSNWEKSDLSVEQINYAVNDVRASFGVFEAVMKGFQLNNNDEIAAFVRPIIDLQLRAEAPSTTPEAAADGSPKPATIIVPRRSVALAQLLTRNALLRMVDMVDRHCPQLAPRLPELWDRYQKTAKKIDIFKQLKDKLLPPGVEEYHILPKLLDGTDSDSPTSQITWGDDDSHSNPVTEKETIPAVIPKHEPSPTPAAIPSPANQVGPSQGYPSQPPRVTEVAKIPQSDVAMGNPQQLQKEQPSDASTPTPIPPPSSEELFVPPDIEELLAAQEAYHKERQTTESVANSALPSKIVPLKDSPPLPPTVRRRKRNPATLPEFVSQPMSVPLNTGLRHQADNPKPVLQNVFHQGTLSPLGQGTVDSVVKKQLLEIQSQLESLKRTGHPELHSNAVNGGTSAPNHPSNSNLPGVKQMMSKIAVDRQLYEVMEATRKHPQVARSGQQGNSASTTTPGSSPAGDIFLSHRGGMGAAVDKHKKSNEVSPDAEVNAWCEDLIRRM